MAIGPLMRLPLATIAGAIIGVVCALAIGWTWHSLNPGHSDLHERLHAVVPLDDSEKQILQAKEQLFATRRGEIEARLRIANRQLADAIAADPKWNPQVERASREVDVEPRLHPTMRPKRALTMGTWLIGSGRTHGLNDCFGHRISRECVAQATNRHAALRQRCSYA